MSNPMPRPHDPRVEPPPPPADPAARKSISPLVWIIFLIAVLAFGWYFYHQRGTVAIPPAEPVAPPAIDIGSAQEAAAERERSGAEVRPALRTPPPAAVPANRAASVVAQAPPAYPAAAFRAREEGTVLVRAEIDASGTATDVSVARRSSSRDLDRAALEAVRGWRFEPAIRDGKAVASTVEVPVEFTLGQQ